MVEPVQPVTPPVLQGGRRGGTASPAPGRARKPWVRRPKRRQRAVAAAPVHAVAHRPG